MSSSRRFEDLRVGESLPRLIVPLSRTLIVATSIASRDYQDVHHDPELARERGSEDIFMNILTSNGFAERFVREWAGPTPVIDRIALRLGAPNYPGDTMVCKGQIVEIRKTARQGVLDIKLENSLGDHATGQVVISFPILPEGN